MKIFLVRCEDVKAHAALQEERFAQRKTVAGSRDHHCFLPTKEKNIGGDDECL